MEVGSKVTLKTLHKISRHSKSYKDSDGMLNAFGWKISHLENCGKEFVITIVLNNPTRYVINGRYVYVKEFFVCQ